MSEFQFIQLADPQLGYIKWRNGTTPERRSSQAEFFRSRGLIPFDGDTAPLRPEVDDLSVESKHFEDAIEVANAIRPEFVVLCGDAVNDLGDEEQRDEVLRIGGNLAADIPMHWVPGNHDICPDYQTPTPDGLQEFRKHFGDDYYSFAVEETLFLVLNSETLNRPELTPGEAERQMEFVREELISKRGRSAQHVISFMHTPLFTHDPETDETGVVSMERRLELLSVFSEHRVEATFAGHLHLNRQAMHRGMQMVVSGAVGQPLWGEPGYRLVAVADHGVSHEYFAL